MFSAAKISGPTGVPDPQFNYVTALLHGDGTNGAQNNTFLDSSSNAFTVTRNGTPTQGSFSPYGTLWSNYFNGSTDYLTTPSSGALTFGTNSFTVEFWVYHTASGASEQYFDSGSNGFSLSKNSSNQVAVAQASVGGILTSTGTVPIGQWAHIAVVRNVTSLVIYINGVSAGSTTNSANFSNSSFYFGRNALNAISFLNAYVSNIRMLNTVAVYTSNFTPPTAPLTAITNTSLLTCQSNRFIDNSTNNFTVTPNGTPSIQRFNPFLPTSLQAYSTSVYGGSGYFNGSTDYLVTPNNSALYLSTNNFTVELWVYLTSTSSFNIVRGTTTDSFGIVYNSGSFLYYLSSNGSSWNIASGVSMGASSAPLNTWIHVALVRNGNTFTPYINGVAGTTTTSSSAIYQTNGFYLFAEAASGGSGFSYGYSSDFRIVNGSAVYTTNFTPPTAPLTAITNTSLLLSMQNAGIYDNAMMLDWITNGSAQISTSVKKYGTGSIYLNGSSYLTSPTTQNLAFGTGDYTIEFWINPTSVSTFQRLIYFSDNNDNVDIAESTSGALYYYNGSTSTGSSGGVLSAGTWQHIAIVRSSGTVKGYVNGTSVLSTSTTPNSSSRYLQIGYSAFYSSGPYTGYIDDIRITNGYARYTSNFTPPTSAFPNY